MKVICKLLRNVRDDEFEAIMMLNIIPLYKYLLNIY